MITVQHEDFSDYCPSCEEQKIKDVLYDISQEDDFEDNLDYAKDHAKLCRGCHADEMDDFNRM